MGGQALKTARAISAARPRPESGTGSAFFSLRTLAAAVSLAAFALVLPSYGAKAATPPTETVITGVPAGMIPTAKPSAKPPGKPAQTPVTARRGAQVPPAPSAPVGESPDSCLDSILAAETEHGIPRGLLLGIALVESGRGGYPAPFALSIRGKAVYAKSEAEAARYLRDPQGKLRGGVMAGCMQLSLSHHKNSFRPVDRIVNPQANVRFAARYLVQLRADTGSWAGAVARYNGGTNGKGRLYQCKVHRQLTALGAASADLFDATRCKPGAAPQIAEVTRRAFDRANAKPVS